MCVFLIFFLKDWVTESYKRQNCIHVTHNLPQGVFAFWSLPLFQFGWTPISVVILDLTCSNRSVSYTFGNLACVQLGWYVEINFRSIWLWYPKILKCTTCTVFHTYTCVVRSLSGYIWWWNSPRCHYCWWYGYTLDDGPNGQIQWG